MPQISAEVMAVLKYLNIIATRLDLKATSSIVPASTAVPGLKTSLGA